jgi:hypothetical protein
MDIKIVIIVLKMKLLISKANKIIIIDALWYKTVFSN